jgi:hypothetical protein
MSQSLIPCLLTENDYCDNSDHKGSFMEKKVNRKNLMTFLRLSSQCVRSMHVAWEWLRDSALYIGSRLRHVTFQWL